MSFSSYYLTQWSKENRKKLCRDFFSKKEVQKGQKIALFMAGSPGAGKTEFIRRLLSDDQHVWYYILDLDEIRSWMPKYKWKYAEKYTKWAIKILEMLIDECIHNEYPFVLDGTFTSTKAMERNIERLINKNYKIGVFYIHTVPELAWLYTLYRGKDEWRLIPVSRFIRDYYLAPENICLFSEKYQEAIDIYIVNKKYEDGTIKYDLFPADNSMSIHDFFDKHTILDYTIKNRLSRFKYGYYKFISHVPLLWKKLLKNIILKKEQWVSQKLSK